MYFKLAIQNVKKSFKDYMIYFLTLAFSVCLFYTFNSFQAQQAVLELGSAQIGIISSLQFLMMLLSIFVAIILGFLIIYANNFLIKRRKKELGLYALLGMPKQRISMILIYETLLVGMLSLLTGLIAGVFASQLLTVVTANLFEVILNYSFIFSVEAMMMTIVAFALIFFIIMVFNTFILNHYKLIDLLKAEQVNEQSKIKNIYISIAIFVLSIVILAYTYSIALNNGMDALTMLDQIAPLGILGTVLFFMSLSGFLLKFVQSSKTLYFRKLNMFVLRQVNASVNSNFLSMSIVCIMLLFSIGALATGTNLNRTINNAISLSTPYDYSYYGTNIANIKEDLQLDTSMIADDFFVHDYHSDTTMNVFQEYMDLPIVMSEESLAEQLSYSYEVVPLSEFNRLRRDANLKEITLEPQEAYLFTSSDLLSDMVNSVLRNHPTIPLYGEQVHIVNDDFEYLNLGTTINTGTFMFGVAVQDELIPNDAQVAMSYWNVTLQDHIEPKDFDAYMMKQIEAYKAKNPQAGNQYDTYPSACSTDVREANKGISVVITYIGIYLGLVFLLSSAVILALQQLSQASDNKLRYQILNKIGAEKKMLNHAILLQLSIYFLLPLTLAIVHSVVGIQVVNTVVKAFGKGDLFMASLITGGIILLIYGSYYFVTYLGTKRILTK